MDILKKLFPISWSKTKDSNDLVKGLIIYIVGAIIAAAIVVVAITILSILPLGDILAGIVGTLGSLIGLYTLVGIILLLLVYFKVIND